MFHDFQKNLEKNHWRILFRQIIFWFDVDNIETSSLEVSYLEFNEIILSMKICVRTCLFFSTAYRECKGIVIDNLDSNNINNK